MKPQHILLICVLFGSTLFTTLFASAHNSSPNLTFIANQNQWHNKVVYQVAIGEMNTVFLEENAFTYVFFDAADVSHLHELSQLTPAQRNQFCLNGHSYQMEFVGAQKPQLNGLNKKTGYHNYFLGKDPSKWAACVPLFEGVEYKHLYNGIDLKVYSSNSHFKYDFIVQPHVDAQQIQLQYKGMNRLKVRKGNLLIQTSVETIIEQQPYAYQIIDGREIEVPCFYDLDKKNSTVGFKFPDSYNKNYPLIIDPILVASTLSGSLVTGGKNFGHCATFDNGGNIYTGAISFGAGYPTDLGSFQSDFGGEVNDSIIPYYTIDIAVSKLNRNGSELIYATYLGGESQEFPHSLIVDEQNNLYIYGTSNSDDYPVTENTFQSERAGLLDIIVTVVNHDGSELIGSTFVGGNLPDGYNYASANHGDAFRGEIMIDEDHNIYVASCTFSEDFPITTNAFQDTLAELQDGVVFKMNPDVSQLEWSTYLGSSRSFDTNYNYDMCYGLRLDEDRNVYVCGSAADPSFPMNFGGLQPFYAGGDYDAFIVHLSNDGSSIINSTFWGTNEKDIAFFIDLDNEEDPVIFGQSYGEINHFPADVYHQPNSNQFISAFTKDLSTLKYSTAVGGDTGTNFTESSLGMAPVAFMVDNCGYIYFSGYGVDSDLETSPDAFFDSSCETCNVYVGVLEPEATGFFYGTYYTGNHVDGGTSRFDDGGVIYQALCNCDIEFNVLPDAYSNTQPDNCDVAVFKIDLETPGVNAVANGNPQLIGCAPFLVDFTNLGSKGESFEWIFELGAGSTLDEPSYTFTAPGTYEVQLIATSPTICTAADTTSLEVIIWEEETTTYQEFYICGDEPLILEANDGRDLPLATYEWADGSTNISFDTEAQAGVYWVNTYIGNCVRTDSFQVIVNPLSTVELDLGTDTMLCQSDILSLNVSDIDFPFSWQDGSTDPVYNISFSGVYSIELDFAGCQKSDTIVVDFVSPPNLYLEPNQALCEGSILELQTPIPNNPDVEYYYTWQDGYTGPTYLITEPGTYWVTIESNVAGCSASDTIVVSPINNTVELGDAIFLCETEPYTIQPVINNPNELLAYNWSTGATSETLTVEENGVYIFEVTNIASGCVFTDSVEIVFFDQLFELDDDLLFCDGESHVLDFSVDENLKPAYLWNNGSIEPTYTVTESGFYEVNITLNGCTQTRSLTVEIFPPLPTIDLGEDRVLCSDETFLLEVPNDGNLYTWQDGSTNNSFLVNESGDYSVRVSNSCGTVEDQLRIEIINLPAGETPIMLPSAFTPNNDDLNDFFQPQIRGLIENYELVVFNRWGQKVFESQDYNLGWDGWLGDKVAEMGVYVWICSAIVTDCEGVKKDFYIKGNTTLIR